MNIIYSITNRTYSLFRGAIVLILGLALLIWPDYMLNTIVKLIASFLIVAGLVALYITASANKKDPNNNGNSLLSAFASVNIIVYLAFGLIIFLFPSFFVSILVFLFGAILLLLGISQLANLIISGKHIKISAYLYIVPILVTICGIVLFFQPFTAKNILTMFFGGCLACSGAVELLSAWILRKTQFSSDGKYIDSVNK